MVAYFCPLVKSNLFCSVAPFSPWGSNPKGGLASKRLNVCEHDRPGTVQTPVRHLWTRRTGTSAASASLPPAIPHRAPAASAVVAGPGEPARRVLRCGGSVRALKPSFRLQRWLNWSPCRVRRANAGLPWRDQRPTSSQQGGHGTPRQTNPRPTQRPTDRGTGRHCQGRK